MNSNIPLGRNVPLNSFRQHAVWAWGRSTSPNVYLPVDFNVTATLNYLDNLNRDSDISISIFHAFLKAMGLVMEKFPYLNRVLLGQKIYMRNSIDFFIIKTIISHNTFDSYDLSGFQVNSPQDIRLGDFRPILKKIAGDIEREGDQHLNACTSFASRCPLLIAKAFVRFYDWVSYTLNIHPRSFGFPRDRFGSMWVSNIGVLGLPPASVPHFPISRCGLGASVGKIEKQAIVQDQIIIIQDIMPVTFTIDHRLFDASHLADAIEYLKTLFSEPQLLN